MSDSTLYDDDILLWSEQQAAVIRRLRETVHGLPNDLDVENVAEEIESVGRSELATVESYIELILVHLIKLAVEPDADSVLHWSAEVAGFAANLERRYAPSMRHHINMEKLWRSARRQTALAFGERKAKVLSELPSKCPVAIEDLLDEEMDIPDLTMRLMNSEGSSEPPK